MQKENINTTIERILKESKTIAVVGLSAEPSKPSYQVASYLQRAGYVIYPVNPKYDEVLGRSCYPSLSEIPETIDIVDIYRRPVYVLPVVEESIKIGAKVIWMQLGIENEEAARLAGKAGLQVIMNRCLKIEHARFIVN
jgi:predicted CoA-binding protein